MACQQQKMTKIIFKNDEDQCVKAEMKTLLEKINFMKNTNNIETARKMDKQALKVFSFLAFCTYLSALAYCYFTGNIEAFGILAAVMLALGILIYAIYHSIGTQPKSNSHVTTSEPSLRYR